MRQRKGTAWLGQGCKFLLGWSGKTSLLRGHKDRDLREKIETVTRVYLREGILSRGKLMFKGSEAGILSVLEILQE